MQKNNYPNTFLKKTFLKRSNMDVLVARKKCNTYFHLLFKPMAKILRFCIITHFLVRLYTSANTVPRTRHKKSIFSSNRISGIRHLHRSIESFLQIKPAYTTFLPFTRFLFIRIYRFNIPIIHSRRATPINPSDGIPSSIMLIPLDRP